uniref:Uncharacterized protein n=1 Tax=Anguilla anguilla TaxID=7936 RepID=A0A0E9XZY6_ANGAN
MKHTTGTGDFYNYVGHPTKCFHCVVSFIEQDVVIINTNFKKLFRTTCA